MSLFEKRYREDPDPWGYETSAYEQAKYLRTLDACGPGPFDWALELGGSIGVFSAMLAPRCRHLTTIDSAPTAVATARARLDGVGGVDVRDGEIPADMPDGPFDLVVASELLYYLGRQTLDATLAALETRTSHGARVVAVHFLPTGPERPQSADEVHDALRDRSWLRSLTTESHEQYLLDVLERQ